MRTVCNPDEVFDAVKAKWSEQIPALFGEIVSGWLQHRDGLKNPRNFPL